MIGGLWEKFYGEGIHASVPGKVNKKALGIYTDYSANEKNAYTAMAACETDQEPPAGVYSVCHIPAGRYAKFVVHGDMVQAVAAAWMEIWCDFEECQDDCMDNAEIHIYVGLSE